MYYKYLFQSNDKRVIIATVQQPISSKPKFKGRN